jgi:hypothetical protein
MQQVLTSVVAVVGTLLGSYLTYLFQRRMAERTGLQSRRERRRQEFAEAVAVYASTATALRRAEFDRGKKPSATPQRRLAKRLARRPTAFARRPAAPTTW